MSTFDEQFQTRNTEMMIGKKTSTMIMEPQTDGHRGPYAAWMAKGLADRGVRVTLVTHPKSLDDASLYEVSHYKHDGVNGSINILTPFLPQLYADIDRKPKNLVASQIAYWRLFRGWYKNLTDSVSPDVVFVPYLDYCLYAIGLLGSPFDQTPWVGLPMRSTFHFRQMGVIAPTSPLIGFKRALFFRVLKNRYLRNLLTIDTALYEFLYANKFDREKLVMLPEPAEFDHLPDPTAAKSQLGVKLGRRLILVYGTITKRKGILELLRALVHQMFPVNVDVLFAGKVDGDANHLLNDPIVVNLVLTGRLKVIDRFIEKHEVATLLAAADIVWLGYRSHYVPSGVLVQAVRARVPVIACEEGLIGWQTRRYGLGEVVKPSDVNAVVQAVLALCAGKTSRPGANDFAQIGVGDTMKTSVDALLKALFGNLVLSVGVDTHKDCIK